MTVFNLVLLCGSSLGLSPAILAESATRDATAAYGKLPLQFEPNHGQTNSRVKFLSRGSRYNLFLTSTEAVLAGREHRASLRMRFVGTNGASRVEGIEELPGKVNYLIGNDPKKWRSDVPTYGRVKYEALYPGIDLVYYGTERQLEYDFIIAPGADPKKIRLAFSGADAHVDSAGDLVLDSAGSQIRLRRPVIYQEVGGRRQEIAGGFVLEGRRRVTIQVAAYDLTKPLTIDPVLVYSTYLGGSGFEFGNTIAADADGNAYVAGSTRSLDFPTTSGAFDVTPGGAGDIFVAKLNASGDALLYATYLGGLGDDAVNRIAVDGNGNAYLTGSTQSADFPTTLGAFDRTLGGPADAFVAKLDPTGSALVYSTYLGGSSSEGATGLAVDGVGNAYVTGSTSSIDFPTTPGAFDGTLSHSDAFVTKLNTNGSALVYSTLLAGSFPNSSGGTGIAVDADGHAYVTGTTSSSDFPTTPGAFQTVFGGTLDVFVTKLNAAGSDLMYSTFLGGSYFENSSGIAVDTAGSAYVTGTAQGSDFPTTPGAFDRKLDAGLSTTGFDAFVTKFNADGSALVYSTFVGSSGSESGSGIAVDGQGNAYIVGDTSFFDFPTTSGAFDTTFNGSLDAFLTKLNVDGSGLLYSTYLGGTGFDRGFGVAVDLGGNAYVTGLTSSSNFPTSVGAFDGSLGGSGDAFVAKLQTAAPASLTVTKLVVNDNGGPRQIEDFPLFVDGTPVISDVPVVVGTGVHTVSETSRSGYAATFGGDCAADGSITLNAGDVRKCTITNNDIPDIYLRRSGSDLLLDTTAPAAAAASSRDSAAVAFSGGNPWKEIGTWRAAPGLLNGSVVGLNDLRVFLGLRNSDDEGTRFDVRAEVEKGDTVLSVGQTLCVSGVTRNPDLAKEVVISLPSFAAAASFGADDVLSVKVSARIGTAAGGGFCGGHGGATGLRLYFDAASRPSRIGLPVAIVVDGNPRDWSGIAPIVTDPAGNAPPGETDFMKLSVTNDSRKLYFLFEFARDYAAHHVNSVILLNTDLDPSTGCVGFELLLDFVSPRFSDFISDFGDCSGSDDFPGALSTAFSGRFLEVSLPIDTLRSVTPGVTGFDFQVSSGVFSGFGRYLLR